MIKITFPSGRSIERVKGGWKSTTPCQDHPGPFPSMIVAYGSRFAGGPTLEELAKAFAEDDVTLVDFALDDEAATIRFLDELLESCQRTAVRLHFDGPMPRIDTEALISSLRVIGSLSGYISVDNPDTQKLYTLLARASLELSKVLALPESNVAEYGKEVLRMEDELLDELANAG